MTAYEEELSRILDLLGRVGDRCSQRTHHNEGKFYAAGFAFKLSGHAISALTLLRDKSALTADGRRFLDRTSVCVLARAGCECFLLFHHIFIAPGGDEDERQIRYLRWSIESLRKRQHFETLLPGQAEQLRDERRGIEDAEAEIRGNAAFSKRCQKQQDQFLDERGRWRPGWAQMATTAGIAKLYARDHYSYLCDHAHTGPFSVELLKGTMTDEDEAQLRNTVAMTLAVAVANVVSGLTELFPEARRLTADDSRLIDRWVQAGRTVSV